jgi:hypothetical protein
MFLLYNVVTNVINMNRVGVVMVSMIISSVVYQHDHLAKQFNALIKSMSHKTLYKEEVINTFIYFYKQDLDGIYYCTFVQPFCGVRNDFDIIEITDGVSGTGNTDSVACIVRQKPASAQILFQSLQLFSRIHVTVISFISAFARSTLPWLCECFGFP